MVAFIKILRQEQAVKTILPALNHWLLYVMLFVILTGIFNAYIAGLVFVFFQILERVQTAKTKKAFYTLWYKTLPIFKFHLVLVFVQVGVLIGITKLFVFSSSNKNLTDNGG